MVSRLQESDLEIREEENFMKCSYCESENTAVGELEAGYGFHFKAEYSKIYDIKESKVEATACLNCGRLFEFRLKDVNKVKGKPKGFMESLLE